MADQKSLKEQTDEALEHTRFGCPFKEGSIGEYDVPAFERRMQAVNKLLMRFEDLLPDIELGKLVRKRMEAIKDPLHGSISISKREFKAIENPDDHTCDYAHLPHSGGGTNHGPATHSKGGYNICDACYDAIIEADKREEEYYKQAAKRET